MCIRDSYVMAAFGPIPLSLMALDDTRQIGVGYLKNFTAVCLAGLIILIPVSYTHLDVYKRQWQCCQSGSRRTSVNTPKKSSASSRPCLLYTSRCV